MTFTFFAQNQEDIKFKELVNYVIVNQQTIYDRKEEVYTDSICVADFNFNIFKYSEKVKFENPNGYKLYFVDNDIRKIDFNYNSENITLMILNYKNLKIAISKSIFLDVFVFDLQKGKTINLNFETKGIHNFPNELIPLEISDLKKLSILIII